MITGAAVTAVKIKFVDHEFSTIPHVKEDVIQIILNLKQLRLRSTSSEPVRLFLKAKGEKIVTAADIEETDQVQVVNKDLHIATLDSKQADFDMELIVEQGRGYVPVEARENQKLEIGMLAIDAIYTPVKSVYYDISNVRVGQITNFDKLELVMETDGTMTGQEAADISAKILVDHFRMIFSHMPESIEVVESSEESDSANLSSGESVTESIQESSASLDDLGLSNRAKNALIKSGIATAESLKALSDDQINSIEGLGKKTITEILTALGR
jgi:DNA-directed RNA polymerase subunit alpha